MIIIITGFCRDLLLTSQEPSSAAQQGLSRQSPLSTTIPTTYYELLLPNMVTPTPYLRRGTKTFALKRTPNPTSCSIKLSAGLVPMESNHIKHYLRMFGSLLKLRPLVKGQLSRRRKTYGSLSESLPKDV